MPEKMVIGFLPRPSGQKLPNNNGLYDMAGKGSEWIWTEPTASGIAMGGEYHKLGQRKLQLQFVNHRS